MLIDTEYILCVHQILLKVLHIISWNNLKFYHINTPLIFTQHLLLFV